MDIKKWKGKQSIKIMRCNNFNRKINLLKLEKKLKDNLDKLIENSEQNNKMNTDGLIVLSKDDEWRDENEWDELLNKTK